MKRNIVLVVIVLAVLLGAFTLFKKKNNEQNDYYQVKKTDVIDKLVFAGVVDAERRADLGFATGGRIIKNNAKEGQWVKKGQVLAEIDQSGVRAGLTQAMAQYQLTKVDNEINSKSSEVSYEKLIKEQNKVVENLKKEYLSGDLQAYFVDESDADFYTKPPVVSGVYIGNIEGKYLIQPYRSHADSGYSFNYSGLEEGVDTVEIYQPGKLGTKGLFLQFQPKGNYNNKEFIIPIPNTRSSTFLARKTAYENALVKRDKLIAEAKLQKEKFIKDEGQQGDYANARLQQAAAQVRSQSLRLSDGKIIAPFDGYIVKNNLELGETVQALVPQITMFASKKKKLVLNTPEIYINKIHVGDHADIILDAYPDDVFSGTITKIDDIDTMVDGVPVYETDVSFDQEDDRVRVGMNAHAEIVASKHEGVLAIPKHYIHKDEEGREKVYLIKGDEIQEGEIQTGLTGNDGFVEILSGLQEGDKIVLKKD